MTPDSAPVVLVVDDDVSVREAMDLMFRSSGLRCEAFDSAAAFLARPRCTGPSCLVLDVQLPDLNGLALQQQLAGDRAEMPIIFITGYGDIPMSVKAMKSGAAEFLTKPVSEDVLLGAVRAALDRSARSLTGAAELRTLQQAYDTLSDRERSVIDRVVTGQLNKQVGVELGISEVTVKAHRGKMMRKMGADSLAQLVNIARLLHPARH